MLPEWGRQNALVAVLLICPRSCVVSPQVGVGSGAFLEVNLPELHGVESVGVSCHTKVPNNIIIENHSLCRGGCSKELLISPVTLIHLGLLRLHILTILNTCVNHGQDILDAIFICWVQSHKGYHVVIVEQ